jgi:hypothetical protein
MRRWHQLGVLVVGLIVSAGPAQAQTTLRYKFKAGDKLGYNLEQKMKMTTSVMGKDFDIQMNQTMDMTWEVLKVDKDGSGHVKIGFKGVKMVMDGPMGQIEIDSKNAQEPNDFLGKMLFKVVSTIAGMEMTFTMDGTGEIKDIKIPEKVKESIKNLPGAEAMGDMFSDEGLKKMAQGGIVLPKEAVTKGKSWNQKTDMKTQIGRMKGDLRLTYEGTVEKDGKKLEKIAVKPNVTLEPAANAKVQMKLNNQDGKGYVYFDNDAGRMAEVTMHQVMDMAMEAANQAINMKMDQNLMMKLAK